MDKKTYKLKKLIEQTIKEHNEIWKDIGCANRKFYRPAGYNCFNLSEDQIITIASGLARKIKILL